MPKYRLHKACYLQVAGDAGPRHHEAGAEIEFSGTPNAGMLPLDEAAREAWDKLLGASTAHSRLRLEAQRGLERLPPAQRANVLLPSTARLRSLAEMAADSAA